MESINDDEFKMRRQFQWFAVIASINHALFYIVTAYASSLLDSLLGGVIVGLSWMLNCVSGLLVATPALHKFGFRDSMLIAMLGYSLQIGTFSLAVIYRDVAWPIAIIGAVISGFTSAIWWTAQGVYFEHICSKIAKTREDDSVLSSSQSEKTRDSTLLSPINDIRSDLSAQWTVIYQCSDVAVFLSLSVIPLMGASIATVLIGLTVLGLITTLLGFTFEKIQKEEKDYGWTQMKESIKAVPAHFNTDARLSLLSPFVFGFGIATAAFAFYVNDKAVSESADLGVITLGFLEAFSYMIAVISAYPYAAVADRVPKGQDWVIQFGSFSFLFCGVLIASFTSGELGNWGLILLAKGFYGLGRGVFEGSCRAVYAEMFTGDNIITAFSAQTLSAGISGGISFLIFGLMSHVAIGMIMIINGVFALSCYFFLMFWVDQNLVLSWSGFWSVLCGSRSSKMRNDLEFQNLEKTNGKEHLDINKSQKESLRTPILQ